MISNCLTCISIKIDSSLISVLNFAEKLSLKTCRYDVDNLLVIFLSALSQRQKRIFRQLSDQKFGCLVSCFDTTNYSYSLIILKSVNLDKYILVSVWRIGTLMAPIIFQGCRIQYSRSQLKLNCDCGIYLINRIFLFPRACPFP